MTNDTKLEGTFASS